MARSASLFVMDWLARIGTLLQLVGIWMAYHGVARAYEQAYASKLTPDLVADAASWWPTKVLRRPQHRTIQLDAAIGGTATAFAPTIQIRPTKPETDADIREHVAYVTALAERLAEEAAEERKRVNEYVQRTERRLVGRLDELSARVEDAHSTIHRIEVLTVGRDGSGVREAARGLAIAFVGTVLSLF